MCASHTPDQVVHLPQSLPLPLASVTQDCLSLNAIKKIIISPFERLQCIDT